MKIAELIEGLQIIAKYQSDEGLDIHDDALFAGRYEPEKMSEEDRARMEELGWTEEEESWMIDT